MEIPFYYVNAIHIKTEFTCKYIFSKFIFLGMWHLILLDLNSSLESLMHPITEYNAIG
jgi:hypothetical protein